MAEVIAGHIGILIGIIVLVYAYLVYRNLKSLPVGSDRMKELASAIHEGAMVFLRREYKTIGIFAERKDISICSRPISSSIKCRAAARAACSRR